MKNRAADETYNYLGITEADGIERQGMEEMMKNEYRRLFKLVLTSKLNGMS